MKISSGMVNTAAYTNANSKTKEQKEVNQKTQESGQEQKEVKAAGKDEYIPSSQEEKAVTYSKPKVDQATIAKLKEDSERIYGNLKRMVEELLARQGMTFEDVFLGKAVQVDEAYKTEAQAMLGEGGDLSPEKVSDRIVDFAKAISGGDKSKFEALKGAIEEGFKQAARALGGELPEISKKTYDLVMEKLNKWAGEEVKAEVVE